ncbi:hypothetical protein A8709_32930 [Paenibacillus pectinilyticus]|uniref:Uncharacterized protein n=1 Tax=Paenibacillus pectinilyticus TaxID=512399 RepID=A0A1C0ZX03_9BACL|nr:hypothetical protein [Paenibacillus pectinilyticus]OCT12617.1 hypothetical protein A8709_32930 [Paenibacillus pectinilyticus]
MESTQQKVDRLQAELDALNAQSPRNETAINQTAIALDEAKRELAQQAAEQIKIQDAAIEFVSALDTMDFDGLTLRQVIGSEDGYQLVTIELKKAFIAQADEFSKQLTGEIEQRLQLQSMFDAVSAKIQAQDKEIDDTNRLLNEEKFARAQAEQYRDNAAKQLEEAKKEVERLNAQVDDLRKEIAVGAREAYKVVDTEAEAQKKKELADKIRKDRTVYDVVPDNVINPKNYTAKLVATDEVVNYNWTKKNFYIELTDENEILQFRQQYSQPEATESDPAEVATSLPDSVTPEETFPDLPSAELPEVSSLPNTVDQGQQNGEVSAANAGQGQTVEERLSALEAHVFGYVKQAVA